MIGDILYTALRSVISYVLLMTAARLLGHKAISQITFFDFCVAITLGSVSANVGFGGDNSLHAAITVLVSYLVLGLVTGAITLKSMAFRKLVNSEPLILIRNNQIDERMMKKAKMTLQKLMGLLREKNAFNISEVKFAILESDGELSVLLNSNSSPVTPTDLQLQVPERGLTRDVVVDGQLLEENLQDVHLTVAWLLEAFKKQGIGDIKDVFFAAVDSSGGLYIAKRSQSV